MVEHNENTLRRALEDQDRRWEQVHDMIETAREAVRLKMPYDQRPADLFKNLQDALYAIRGRTSLDDLKALAATQEQRGEPGLTENDAKFLDQVATIWSGIDGDPPDSEGIWALKLRAIAAAIRKDAVSSSKSHAITENERACK